MHTHTIAEKLARQPWHRDAIIDLLQFGYHGQFKAAGAYFARRWDVSRRSADRLIIYLIDTGLLKLDQKGSRTQPRIVSVVRGFKLAEQCSDAHSIITSTNYKLDPLCSRGNCGHNAHTPIDKSISDSVRMDSLASEAPTPRVVHKNPARGQPDTSNDTLAPYSGSITRQVADVWGLHRMWAEQRAHVWDRRLQAYDRRLLDRVIEDMIADGCKRPTLPQMVYRADNLLHSYDRVDAPKGAEDHTPEIPEDPDDLKRLHQIIDDVLKQCF